MLSVVIPNRNDSHLSKTIASIRDSSPAQVEIIVVQDGTSRQTDLSADVVQVINPSVLGTSRSRHVGVLAASNDKIVTIDAHMQFHRDTNWAEQLIAELGTAQRLVLCGRMVRLNDDQPDLIHGLPIHRGARIQFKQEPNAYERYALCGAWHNNNLHNEIPCIMGACYAFSRSWYIDGLKAPWQYGTGWGCDEETLSLTNWICGGSSRLSTIEVGHRFGVPRTFRMSDVDLGNVWVNRVRLLHVLPMSEGLRANLLKWVTSCRSYARYVNHVKQTLPKLELDAHTAFLHAQARTVDDFLCRFGVKDIVE